MGQKLTLFFAFFGVFLLFTSDLYGLGEKDTLNLRALGIGLASFAIITGWVLWIINYIKLYNKIKIINFLDKVNKAKHFFISIIIFQTVGGIVGIFALSSQWVLEDIWLGISIVSFPSFLTALYIDIKVYGGGVLQYRPLLIVGGLISGILSAISFISIL